MRQNEMFNEEQAGILAWQEKREAQKEPEKWEREWQDMPQFISERKMACKRIVVSFETEEDMKAFSLLIGRNITMDTRGVYFPVVDKPSREYVDAA